MRNINLVIMLSCFAMGATAAQSSSHPLIEYHEYGVWSVESGKNARAAQTTAGSAFLQIICVAPGTEFYNSIGLGLGPNSVSEEFEFQVGNGPRIILALQQGRFIADTPLKQAVFEQITAELKRGNSVWISLAEEPVAQFSLRGSSKAIGDCAAPGPVTAQAAVQLPVFNFAPGTAADNSIAETATGLPVFNIAPATTGGDEPVEASKPGLRYDYNRIASCVGNIGIGIFMYVKVYPELDRPVFTDICFDDDLGRLSHQETYEDFYLLSRIGGTFTYERTIPTGGRQSFMLGYIGGDTEMWQDTTEPEPADIAYFSPLSSGFSELEISNRVIANGFLGGVGYSGELRPGTYTIRGSALVFGDYQFISAITGNVTAAIHGAPGMAPELLGTLTVDEAGQITAELQETTEIFASGPASLTLDLVYTDGSMSGVGSGFVQNARTVGLTAEDWTCVNVTSMDIRGWVIGENAEKIILSGVGEASFDTNGAGTHPMLFSTGLYAVRNPD